MNAIRLGNIVNKDLSKNIGKLSTGKRINTASDDAAGLAISEKMKGQIRGLNQSSRNIQDGISMIQTAEGALDSVHSLLQRGRELSVQASNGTMTDDDKQKIQEEVSRIKLEVDRIATDTEFNTKKLLNVTDAKSAALQESIIKSLQSGWLTESASLINTHYGLTASTRDIKVVFNEGAVGDDLASVRTTYSVAGNTATVVGMELHIDLADFNPNTGVHGENQMTQAGGKMYNDRIIAHEMVHALMADQMGDDFYDMPTWFKEGTAEFIHGADDRVESVGVAAARTRAKALVAGAAWNGDSLDYAASYIAVKAAREDITTNMSQIMTDIQDGDDTTDNTLGAIYANTSYTNLADFQTGIDNVTLNITPGPGEVDTGAIGGSDHGGGAKTPEDVVPTGTFNANPTNFNIIMPTVESGAEPLALQIGANADQVLDVSLAKVTSDSIGISAVDVTNDASAAITSFDSAISSISGHRARFGAIQNRLEYALKISRNYSENLQASESRISDVDMAKESMAFTKNNILKQAAQAMMAQANQIPQGIMRLIN